MTIFVFANAKLRSSPFHPFTFSSFRLFLFGQSAKIATNSASLAIICRIRLDLNIFFVDFCAYIWLNTLYFVFLQSN